MLFITCLNSNAQSVAGTTIDPSTGNLLSAASGAWSGSVPGSAGGYSGGSSVGFNASTNTVLFGYTQRTTSQSIAINSALQDAGIQVTGYNYSWKINNNTANYYGTLTGAVTLKGTAGNVLETYSYNYNAQNTTGDSEYFQLFSGTQNFTKNYLVGELSTISVEFTGKDSRYWAGYYGPRVRDPHLSLNYRVDPCANNPAFSPDCPGFNDLVTSINLVPYPKGVATDSRPVDNTFPIATVLSSSGSGLTLHGFKYGFVYELKEPYCSSTFLGLFCTGFTDSVARVSAGATNASGQLVFNNNHVFQGANTGPQEMNYQYLFPQSTNTNLMGNFHFSAQVEGNGSIYNMYSKMIVTPDPCMKNVMYSPTCTGFQEAIDKLNGTNKTDYATTGYTEPASVTAGTASSESITYTSTPNGSVVVLEPVQQAVANSSSNSTSIAVSPVISVVSSPVSNNAAASTSSTSTEKSSSGNVSLALSVIAKNKEREDAIATQTVTAAAAIATAASAQAQQDVVTALSTASASASSSIEFAAATASSGIASSASGAMFLQSIQQMNAIQSQSVQSTNDTAFSRTVEVEPPSLSNNMMTDRSNPLKEIIEGPPMIVANSMEKMMQTVNKNVQPNEAAGGVDLGKMAITPQGYNSYLAFTMNDSIFYVPRDIYPRQVNVDNARALRQLSSDRLHQRMVDQQYQGR